MQTEPHTEEEEHRRTDNEHTPIIISLAKEKEE
jgi:hypothetical protein